jgi:hypothetical protein
LSEITGGAAKPENVKLRSLVEHEQLLARRFRSRGRTGRCAAESASAASSAGPASAGRSAQVSATSPLAGSWRARLDLRRARLFVPGAELREVELAPSSIARTKSSQVAASPSWRSK